jgi:alanyl-tRNA synthetase
MQAQVKSLEHELNQAKSRLATAAGNDLLEKAVKLPGGASLLAAVIPGADSKALRNMADQLKDKLKSAVVLLAATAGGKISLVAGVTPDLVGKVKAGDLAGMVAGQIGGKGGGRPDMAMGGGADEAALPAVMAQLHGWVSQRLEGQ